MQSQTRHHPGFSDGLILWVCTKLQRSNQKRPGGVSQKPPSGTAALPGHGAWDPALARAPGTMTHGDLSQAAGCPQLCSHGPKPIWGEIL